MEEKKSEGQGHDDTCWWNGLDRSNIVCEYDDGDTQPPPIFILRVNLFCQRYAPGNILCKNAAKPVEAANMLDSDDKRLFLHCVQPVMVR